MKSNCLSNASTIGAIPHALPIVANDCGHLYVGLAGTLRVAFFPPVLKATPTRKPCTIY